MGSYFFILNPIPALLIHLGLQQIYFISFEFSFGKTIGKFVTKTHVVTQTGEKPSMGQIVGRSFARWIPFEAFSFLGDSPGWHDTLSNTRVVLDEFRG